MARRSRRGLTAKLRKLDTLEEAYNRDGSISNRRKVLDLARKIVMKGTTPERKYALNVIANVHYDKGYEDGEATCERDDDYGYDEDEE